MDTKALPQITLAIWEKGGLSALNRHAVVVCCAGAAFRFPRAVLILKIDCL